LVEDGEITEEEAGLFKVGGQSEVVRTYTDEPSVANLDAFSKRWGLGEDWTKWDDKQIGVWLNKLDPSNRTAFISEANEMAPRVGLPSSNSLVKRMNAQPATFLAQADKPVPPNVR
jgi:hypothetical protein